MNITQVKKAVQKNAEALRKLKENLPIGEIEEILENLRSLTDAVEENLDKIYEKEKPKEVDDLRQSQYEELKGELDNTIADLESLKSSMDDIEPHTEMLEAIDEQTLY